LVGVLTNNGNHEPETPVSGLADADGLTQGLSRGPFLPHFRDDVSSPFAIFSSFSDEEQKKKNNVAISF
jgi:hypothetical protein